MPTILPTSNESIRQAAQLLRSGKAIAFPTETVYGLGANAYNDEAVREIFSIKGRPSHNPLIVHVAALDQLSLVTTNETITRLSDALERLAPFIPGPLSLVLPKNDRICPTVSAGLTTVAVRIPRHETALALLRACEFPVAAPSANPSNYISPTQASHVADQLGTKVKLILDGGACEVGIESTILDLSVASAQILRQGCVTAEELSKVLGISIEQLLRQPDSENLSISAPGMLREHYAPRTPIVLLGTGNTNYPERTGLIYLNRKNRPSLERHFSAEEALSLDGDLADVSQNLFRIMREFDTLDLDLIVIEGCEPTGVGRAIMDRLTRASARWR